MRSHSRRGWCRKARGEGERVLEKGCAGGWPARRRAPAEICQRLCMACGRWKSGATCVPVGLGWVTVWRAVQLCGFGLPGRCRNQNARRLRRVGGSGEPWIWPGQKQMLVWAGGDSAQTRPGWAQATAVGRVLGLPGRRGLGSVRHCRAGLGFGLPGRRGIETGAPRPGTADMNTWARMQPTKVATVALKFSVCTALHRGSGTTAGATSASHQRGHACDGVPWLQGMRDRGGGRVRRM